MFPEPTNERGRMSSKKYQYLSVNVTILKYLGLWLEEDETRKRISAVRMCFICVSIYPSWVGLLLDVFDIMDPAINMALKIQKVLGSTCVAGTIYIAICFYCNRFAIRNLVDGLSRFSRFTDMDIGAVDAKACFFSKIILGYSFAGTLVYFLFPVLLGTNCLEEHAEYMEKHGIPCRSVVPINMQWNYTRSPAYEILMLTQLGVCGLTSIFIVNSTMLVCGLLEHAINHLKEIRKLVLKIATLSTDRIDAGVKFTVRYHCDVIDFVNDVNEAFGSQLVMHLTLTSVVIGLLGFEMLIVNYRQALAYALHLIGWFIILYNVCHYGQMLIDESVGVAESAYLTPWYESPVRVQKDIKLIILRSQKPLTLKALNLGIMSEPTFLNVITSSYSYFALLLKIKNQ